MGGLAVVTVVFPATAQSTMTHFPPEIQSLSGELWNARVDGGSGVVVQEDAELTVGVTRRDASIANVEMLVDGQRRRPEHLLPLNEAQSVAHTFTFHPADVALMAPSEVEVQVVARDTEAYPPMATDPENGETLGISAEVFRVRIPRDTFSPVVTASNGNLVAGWADDTAEVVFDATDGTGIREARLIIDGTVRANAVYPCDFTRPRPCENRSGASLAANVAGLGSGEHTWQLEVVDGAGNVARTPSEGFVIDWIREAIVAQMALPDSDIVSVGDHETLEVLDVGMTNPAGAEAADLKARYGDAIVIQQEESPESLAGTPEGDPVPGADAYRDPMLAGVRIYPPWVGPHGRGSCTSGFMFKGVRSHPELEPEGVITAGHCFEESELTEEWRQGGHVLGPFTSHRFVVPRTYADAGTINTWFPPVRSRRISDRVFVGGPEPEFEIERIAPPSSGRRGLEIRISGAYGGYAEGVIDRVGRGRTPSGRFRGYEFRLRTNDGRWVVVRNVYRMRRNSGRCRTGDSGAPVFRHTGTAMGIAFARVDNGQRCLFAQQSWVEWELNRLTYTGGD